MRILFFLNLSEILILHVAQTFPGKNVGEESDKSIGSKSLALIVAGIVVGTALLCGFVYIQMEEDRVVYLTVEADKEVFTSNENVTFRLVSLSGNRDFELVDTESGSDEGLYGGIDIWKIPETVDHDALLEDPMASQEFYSRAEFYPYTAKIHFDRFSSEDEPLQLSWNGTVAVDEWSEEGHRYLYYPATSGYYMIAPSQSVDFADDDYTFIIGKDAIFFYDSLGAGIALDVNPGENVTYDLTMRAPVGTVGTITGDLNATLSYPGDPFNATDDARLYWNETGITLSAGADTLRTLEFNISVPDMGYPHPGAPWFPTLPEMIYLDAVLTTLEGEYHFGMWVKWKGGLTFVYQY